MQQMIDQGYRTGTLKQSLERVLDAKAAVRCRRPMKMHIDYLKYYSLTHKSLDNNLIECGGAR